MQGRTHFFVTFSGFEARHYFNSLKVPCSSNIPIIGRVQNILRPILCLLNVNQITVDCLSELGETTNYKKF